jgi:uncharacterized membrane protein
MQYALPISEISLVYICLLTLSLLMLYIQYMELLVKPEILLSYVYGPTFGNAESRLFLFAAQCFNAESMQKVILWHSCV